MLTDFNDDAALLAEQIKYHHEAAEPVNGCGTVVETAGALASSGNEQVSNLIKCTEIDTYCLMVLTSPSPLRTRPESECSIVANLCLLTFLPSSF